MTYKKCPICELNYILDTESICKECAKNSTSLIIETTDKIVAANANYKFLNKEFGYNIGPIRYSTYFIGSYICWMVKVDDTTDGVWLNHFVDKTNNTILETALEKQDTLLYKDRLLCVKTPNSNVDQFVIKGFYRLNKTKGDNMHLYFDRFAYYDKLTHNPIYIKNDRVY